MGGGSAGAEGFRGNSRCRCATAAPPTDRPGPGPPTGLDGGLDGDLDGVADACAGPERCPDLVAKLEQIAKDRKFVMTAPYPLMSARIALTAWGRIDTLSELDLPRIHRFIDAYAGKDHHSTENRSLSALEQ